MTSSVVRVRTISHQIFVDSHELGGIVSTLIDEGRMKKAIRVLGWTMAIGAGMVDNVSIYILLPIGLAGALLLWLNGEWDWL